MVSFLDGLVEDVISDVNNIENGPHAIGLELSIAKCQLLFVGDTEEEREIVKAEVMAEVGNIIYSEARDIRYLGSPLLPEGLAPALEQHISTAIGSPRDWIS